MGERELRRFIAQKNAILSQYGEKICIDLRNAYEEDVVQVSTTMNLNQDEILTHLLIDKANGTLECASQIRTRIEGNNKPEYKPDVTMIDWKNNEYIVPMSCFVVLFLISFTFNFFLYLKSPSRTRQG